MINDQQTWTRNISTAARMDFLDRSSHRLRGADRGMLRLNAFPDVSDKPRAPAWSVSVDVHGSEG
jgi:hypothetical protein